MPKTIPTRGLVPGCVWRTKDIFEAMNWGASVLMQARASGLVKPIVMGRELLYETDQLIEWLKTLPRKSK